MEMERQLGRVRNSFALRGGINDLNNTLFNIHSKTVHLISQSGTRATRMRDPLGAHIIMEDGNANN